MSRTLRENRWLWQTSEVASNSDLEVSPATSAEQFIAQYPLAIVVSAEWQPNEGQ